MVKHLILYLLLGAATELAQAEALRDPTMPANLSAGAAQANGLGSNGSPILQSVTLGSELKYAMINGQTIKLGARFDRYTLVKLSANQAVLKAADGELQVLKMDYAIQKTAPNQALANQTSKLAKPMKANLSTTLTSESK
jgi:hypothetical protein